MPTISQLPAATSVSAADEIPLNQGGTLRSVSVGTLLAAMQPAISVDSAALLGRQSIGAGSPEQIDVGTGLSLPGGTLVANGSDHASFPALSTFSTYPDLVISNKGSPMLMQAALLRGLFSAGENVAIDPNGVISTVIESTNTGTVVAGSSISELQSIPAVTAGDLVAISHAGSDYAIVYSNLLGGVTIDQAQAAAPAGDSDTFWVAQGSNVMASQTFSALWAWVASKVATYKLPVVEISVNTNLDTTVHNDRILVCSQSITLTPLTTNMGSGFQCSVINASSGNVIFGSGFVSSSGSLILPPWQSAKLLCITYSAGTIAFVVMPATTGAIGAVPGQVTGLSASAITTTTITVSWQPPSGGGAVASYVLQFRPTGSTLPNVTASVLNATTYALTALSPTTSYDIAVFGNNAVGAGAASAILTVATATPVQQTVPQQVNGVTATPTSSSVIQLAWSAQAGSNAATSFTVQYKVTGSPTWAYSLVGVTGAGNTISGLTAATSYDFSVIGVNNAGSGLASATVSAVTMPATGAVTSIAWNLIPTGTYTHGTGAIGANALVAPAASPIHFGFSTSATTPPSSWTAAANVNTNLWGAYVPTPATAGTWYVWAEGLDGSARTVNTNSFLVQ